MPKKLLLADDSVTIQRVIELTFADEDVVVIAVGDGQQAIDRIDAERPDIVLADVGMPNRNGYEVAAHIKSSPQLQHIPVLLLTGAFEPFDEARAESIGCDGILAKPFEPQLVISRVKELLAADAKPRRMPKSQAASDGSHDMIDQALVSRATPRALLDLSFAPPLTDHSSESTGSLDDYFDRLDAAFSTMTPDTPGKGMHDPDLDERATRFGWRSAAEPTHDPGPFEMAHESRVLTVPEPAAARLRTPAAPVAEPAGEEGHIETPSFLPAVSVAVPPAVSAVAPPPIADAFAALLAAEQGEALAPAFQPAAPPVPQGGATAETIPPDTHKAPVPLARVDAAAGQSPSIPPIPSIDDVIDEIVTRVLNKLSDDVVRATVSDIVSRVAERLVREEIERIRSKTQ